MKYIVSCKGRRVEVELGADGTATVDGVEIAAALDWSSSGAPPVLHLNGRAVTVSAVREGRGEWRIGLGGLNLPVEVFDERQWAIREIAGGPGVDRVGGVLKAPMPGLVVRVPVEVGESVEPGTPLVVLEAMKMENELGAVGGGVVKAILVSAGQVVEKGASLVEVADSDTG